MSGETYDLFVIGGGINGAAVARDAAGRGLRVGLCEKDDLAAHTSGASTKLIHGGLRYLEHGHLRLVREALRERATLLRAAPHIVRPLTFVLPHHRGLRPAWMLRVGLLAYDLLAGGGPLRRSARVRLRDEALQARYTSGFRYSDCRVDDARLTVLTAMDARTRGAEIMTRTECLALRREEGAWTLTLRREGQPPLLVRAGAVANAAGAWADRMERAAAGGGAPARARLVKGSHIVTRRLYDGDHAFILQNADGRIVFAIPYERDFTLIGTTDIEVATPEEGAAITPAEIHYLCAAVNAYFARPVTPEDVVWSFAGVRALYADEPEAAASPSAISRDDRLVLDADGAPLLSIFGGKLTTHRKVAERALARLAPHLPGMGPAWTEAAILPGGGIGANFDEYVRDLRAAYRWAPDTMLRRLTGAYGTLAFSVLGDARGVGDMGRHFGAGLYQRELDYMIAHEFARTAEDALWRRSKLGLALSAGERRAVAEWMGA